MAQSNWEAEKMLDVYLYDYLVKRNLHATAKSFMTEGRLSPHSVGIDVPGGFLFEWWSVFWDIFIARTNQRHSESATSYLESQQIKAKEQQQPQIQGRQLVRQVQLQQRDPNRPSLSGPINHIVSEGMLEQSNASQLAGQMCEERMKQPNSVTSDSSQNARMALRKSATNHPSQLGRGGQGSFSPAVDANIGSCHRAIGSSSTYGQGILPSRPGVANAGSSLPLNGQPSTGIDQVRHSLVSQVQKPFPQNANQFQLLRPQQQQRLLAQAQGNIGNSSMYSNMDPPRFTGLPSATLNAKDGQQNAHDGSIGSSMQSTSVKMNMPPVQQSTLQQQGLLQSSQEQCYKVNRKRKGASSSGPANSSGTANTIGPSSNSQPTPPSTHTPADEIAMAGNFQLVNKMPKRPVMYGSDGIGGLAPSTTQLQDREHFGDVGAFDDNVVESFLSHDNEDGGVEPLKGNSSEHASETSKAFSFNEVGSIVQSNDKVICCHFSSDGKLLASAGHDRKVALWNMETLQTEYTPVEHTRLITDVRFRPNSTQFATSSFDNTIKLWDASEPNFSINTYKGHISPVLSLDFHPNKTELFCSCDRNAEIRFWNLNQYPCARISKHGSSTHVRFQPRIGQLLATASDNAVSIFDVETDRQTNLLQGHSSTVLSICWDANGDYLASVSQDSVRVWSLVSGECIHDLSASGNSFRSCVFHPSYSTRMVVGGYQSLELWNMGENKCTSMPAHACVISALAHSQATSMVASASHDKCVKIWK